MERRFDHRHLTDLEVSITRLTHPAWSGLGQIADISKTGVCVKTPFELAEGDVIRLEIADSNLFGFVVHASLEGSAFRAGIEVQRVLMGVSDLSRVLHLALRQVLPEVPGVLAGSLPA
ncbi:MAG TPA: PilZ domain-containing protein [Bryobacteraceae bacterium]